MGAGKGGDREMNVLCAHYDLLPTFMDLLGLEDAVDSRPVNLAFHGISLKTVLDTVPANDLCQIKGVGEVKAARLAASFELYRKLSSDTVRQPINSLADTRWLLQDLADEKQEILGYMALDTRNRPIDKRVDLYRGTESVTVADPKQIFKAALNRNAVSLIILVTGHVG